MSGMSGMRDKATLCITRPDDWHLHVRDGAMMAAVLPFSARDFGRAIIMPNLTPPVTTVAEAESYRRRILAALPAGADFHPLMTLYLTADTDPDDLAAGFESGRITAAKLYPAGVTTNSDAGVGDIRKLDTVFRAMADIGMPLLVHGEVNDPRVDIFDREAVFIDRVLAPLLSRLANLRVVLEHITCREAVEFVRNGEDRLAATITPHHLLINRSDLFRGGLRPHLYCLPTPKREYHRRALLAAAVSGERRFFLGTDSAPHTRTQKESACGCAGIFNAPHALALYAGIFDSAGALDRLEAFAALNGPRFYGLPVNDGRIRLEKRPEHVSARINVPAAADGSGGGELIPFRAGSTLDWRVIR